MENLLKSQPSVWYEYRLHQRRTGAPQLYTKDQFTGLHGFRSIFGMSEEVALFVKSQGNSKGLRDHPLILEGLVLDFDSDPAAEKLAEDKLIQRGYQFWKFHTGGRGHHFHIKTPRIERRGISYFAHNLLKQEFEGVDYGVYKPNGMIRLIGTFHSKTGRPKTLVSFHPGKPWDITKETPVVPIVEQEEGFGDQDWMEDRLWRLMATKGQQGQRQTHSWQIAKLCRDLKYSEDKVDRILIDWGLNMCQPAMDRLEINSVIRKVYG